MSDTTVCPNCSAAVPSGASFCTNCGSSIAPAIPAAEAVPPAFTAPAAPAAPAPPVEAGADATRIETPGLHDSTQVLPAAEPPAPPAWSAPPAPTPAPADPAPWAPAGGAAPAPAPVWQPPGAPAAAPPTAPAWDQPAGAPTYGAPAAPAWSDPAAAGPPAWGTPAPAPAVASTSTGGGSPLGGLAAVLGGVLVLVGLFTAWVGFNITDHKVKGWDLTKSDDLFKSKDPYLLLALGIVALAIGVALFVGAAKPIAKIGAIVLGVVVIVTCARDWMTITDVVKKSSVFDGVTVKSQVGFYLTIAGGALAIVGGLLPAKKSA